MKTLDNEIELSTVYSEFSDARGALLDFVFIDDNGDVNFNRSVLLALDRNTSLSHTLTFDLYPGQYRVFVYDIESDGTLSNGVGYPASRDDFTLTTQGIANMLHANMYSMHIYVNTDSPTLSKFNSSCQISPLSHGVISAECTFPSDTMATGFQMIAQQGNSSEVVHSNQSMDLQTPVTVEVEESGVYQVTIFAIREGTGIVGSRYYADVLVTGVATTDTTGIWTLFMEDCINTLFYLQ